MLLITQPGLRAQFLQARRSNRRCADCIIKRGDQLYLSLRNVADEAQKQEVAWAILRLQLGQQLQPVDVPDPLRSILLSGGSEPKPAPLIMACVWGAICAVVGGVLAMALVGLIITILNVPTDSDIGFLATAVAFVLSSTAIGCSTTAYYWYRLRYKQSSTLFTQ